MIHWLTSVDIGLDHLTEVVFVMFLYCKVTFPPASTLYILGESHIFEMGSSAPPPSEQSSYRNYMEFSSWQIGLVMLIYLFNNLFHISENLEIFVLYFGL